jgi:hypothetical protein
MPTSHGFVLIHLVAALWTGVACLGAWAAPGDIAIIDTHAHIIRGRGNPAANVASTLATMKRLNVETTLLLPPPHASGREAYGRPGRGEAHGRRALQGIVRDDLQRFAFLAGGETLNPLIHSVPAERVQAEDLERGFARTQLLSSTPAPSALANLRQSTSRPAEETTPTNRRHPTIRCCSHLLTSQRSTQCQSTSTWRRFRTTWTCRSHGGTLQTLTG